MEHPIVCLIGSTRFEEDMHKEAQRLVLEGNIVFELTCLPRKKQLTDAQWNMLEGMIYEKIDLSDRVHVINKDGYIGESVRKEITYARKQMKLITYMETIEEVQDHDDAGCLFIEAGLDLNMPKEKIANQLIIGVGIDNAILDAKYYLRELRNKLNHQVLHYTADDMKTALHSADDVIESIKLYQKMKEVYLIILGIKNVD